jgi:AcrR family transcriptional regulator
MVKPSGKTRAGRIRRPAATRRPPAPATTTAGRDGTTEQRILDAAHAVFVRAGTAGARTQDIAREAGVNSALLHYYFRSKERLAAAVFTRAATQLLPAVIRILASDLELDEKVAQVVRTEIDHLTRAPYLPGYVISELSYHPERAAQFVAAVTGMVPAEVGRTVFQRLRRQIDERVRDGRMHPIAPDQFVVNLLSLCIFPFAARPMLMALIGLDQDGFARLVERRRSELPAFVLRGLRL